MTCAACDEPFGTGRKAPQGHHDHLTDLAGAHLRRILARAGETPTGHQHDVLKRSVEIRRLLRFPDEIVICRDCNTLENAWKIGSNRNARHPGFLPASFSLLPEETRAAKSVRRIRNSEADVREALRSIWKQQEEAHLRRRLLVMTTVRRFASPVIAREDA